MKINKKMIILILIFSLLIVLIFLLNFLRKGKDEPIVADTPYDMYGAYKAEMASQGITAADAVAHLENDINKYFTIESIIKNFDKNVQYLNSSAKDLNLIVTKDNEAKILEQYKQSGIKYIKDVLAPNYKATYNVDDTYIYDNLSANAGKKYTITDMYVVEDSEFINTYFVYGNYEGKSFNYIIIIDMYRNTYQVYLDNYVSEKNYDKNQVSTMKTLNINGIEGNENNNYQYKNIGQEQIAKIYYEDFLKLMKSDYKQAYGFLDNEYREKRFNEMNDFKKLVDYKYKDESFLEYYSIISSGNGLEIHCKDSEGTNITFKVSSVMKYSVLLDTYTTEISSYEEEYSKLNDEYKAKVCLDKFFECINNGDFSRAYAYLNETFKENNFKTIEEFKEYVTSKWFKNNGFEYQNGNIGEGEYSFSGIIYDIKSEGSYDAEYLDGTFFVKIGKNSRDFVISFSK